MAAESVATPTRAPQRVLSSDTINAAMINCRGAIGIVEVMRCALFSNDTPELGRAGAACDVVLDLLVSTLQTLDEAKEVQL